MNMTMDDSIKRWAAKRKTALVIEIIQAKTTDKVEAGLPNRGRPVAWLLCFNKNTVQRNFRLKGWQVTASVSRRFSAACREC